MHRNRALAVVIAATLSLAACASAASNAPSDTPAGSPTPTASITVVLPSGEPSSAAPTPGSSSVSPASSPPAASGIPGTACEIVTQTDASAAVGIKFPAGKDVSPPIHAPIAARIQCIYTNGASPATNVTVDIATCEASTPPGPIEAQVIATVLAHVGTNGGVTSTASKVTVDGNPGVTSLVSGTGAGGVQVHLETVSFSMDQIVVTVMSNNGPLGAALKLATLVAGKL
jgi:hypothetical protein